MTTLREAVLGRARAFQAFKSAIGADRVMKIVADEYVAAPPGARVLDVGCGFGDLRDHLPEVGYVGVDLSERYVDLARRAHPDAEIHSAGVAELPGLGLTGFDVAVCVGVLHHLDDDEVSALAGDLPAVLRPGGRFVAVEPVWEPSQRTMARVLLALDRGRHVRDEKGYARLVRPVFDTTSTTVRHDLFRTLPYTHCIITATTA